MTRGVWFSGIVAVALLGGLVVISRVLFGQASDDQVFTVTVPSVLSVTAPANASLTHDETDASQAFSTQQYSVQANGISGASISFSTDQAFTHSTNAAFKRNAQLDLAISSSDAAASWTVDTASDVTDHGGSDGVATVAASSTLPGDAVFNLTVTFVTVDFGTLAAGNYLTTVTATITSN